MIFLSWNNYIILLAQTSFKNAMSTHKIKIREDIYKISAHLNFLDKQYTTIM